MDRRAAPEQHWLQRHQVSASDRSTQAGEHPARGSRPTAALPPEDAAAFAAHLRRSRRRRDQRKPQGQTVEAILLDDNQAAALFNISPEQFRKAQRAAWFTARAVAFSPKCKRWIPDELVAQVAHMPRRAAP